MLDSFDAPLPKRVELESRPVPGRGGSVGVDVIFFDFAPVCLGEGTAEELTVDTDGLREAFADLAGFVGASESISIAAAGAVVPGSGVGGFTVGVGIGGTERGESTLAADFCGC